MKRLLFTTLPSNDLGLLTRSLPIATELARRGHQVAFCNLAKSPRVLIADAGFENLVPRHPLYHLQMENLSPRGLYRILTSERVKQDCGNIFNFVRELVGAIPTRFASPTSEIWNAGHAGAMVGMLNENFPYGPGLAMADRSDLLIHHGGYGSCQTGLYTGTPAVIIPTFSERESNARRVAALRAGAFIVPTENRSWRKYVAPEELRVTVRRVLSDPSFTQNARRVSEKMKTYGGASEAAHLIEDFPRLPGLCSRSGRDRRQGGGGVRAGDT